jgi:hypothetical protein
LVDRVAVIEGIQEVREVVVVFVASSLVTIGLAIAIAVEATEAEEASAARPATEEEQHQTSQDNPWLQQFDRLALRLFAQKIF